MITPIKRWVEGLELPHLPKCILMAMTDFTGPDHVCWPSNNRLQRWTGLKERAVRNGIRELEALGMIAIDRCDGRVHRYRLAFSGEATPAPHAGAEDNFWHDVPGGEAPHAPVPPARHAPLPRHVMPLTPARHASPPAPDAAPPARHAPELSNLDKTSLVSTGEAAPAAPSPRPKLALVETSPQARAEPRAHRLPDDWRPSPSDTAYAAELGLDPIRTAQDFRDYWHAKGGKDARKTDWSRTWQVWCRKDHDWGKHLPKGGGQARHSNGPASKYDWFSGNSGSDRADDFAPSDKPILDLAAGDWR